MSSRGVAAFDFDRTITTRDTFVPFMREVAGISSLLMGGISSWRDLFVRDSQEMRARMKHHMLSRTVAGRSIDDVTAAGRQYAGTLPRLYRPKLLSRIEWHQCNGHRLILVSASLRVYAQPAAMSLGFDDVVAVDLAVDGAGLITGDLEGANVRGPEKARRLRELLGPEPGEIWAYGDSAGDTEMLSMADHPTWIGRRARTS